MTNDIKAIPERLRAYRESRNLTQKELAKMLCSTRHSRPTLATKLAKVFLALISLFLSLIFMASA